MPGPYIHLSAMRATAASLAARGFLPERSKRVDPTWTGASTASLAKCLQSRRNFASLGAIGPDLFFFLPDFKDIKGFPTSSVLVFVLRYLEKLYDALDPFVEKYEKYLGPLSEDTAEEMSRLTGGLSETVGNIAGELTDIIVTALEEFVTDQWDIFEFFSLGLNHGWDEKAFLWSDMLHYRKTGQFGRALWDRASKLPVQAEREAAQAYALGYMTHLATDVTGHSLVNAISGGPFRLHWQRHHLVENHMDAFWYLGDAIRPPGVGGDQYPQFTESCLYFDIAFSETDAGIIDRIAYPVGHTLRENWTRNRLLDIDSTLPPFIATTLTAAMRDIFYKDGKHPTILEDNDGRPTDELVRQTYDLLFRFLKMVSADGFSHEPPAPPEVFPNLDFPTPTDPQEESPADDGDDGGSWWDDLLDFILSVIRAIVYILEVAIYLATLPWAVLADLATYPLRLGAYYAFELPLFLLFKHLRAVLVMTGYLAPMQDEIAVGLVHVGNSDSTLFADLTSTMSDVFGGIDSVAQVADAPFRDPMYPRLHPNDEFKHPWQYPLKDADGAPLGGERDPTTAGPYPRNSTPEVLFVGTGTDASILDALEGATTPCETDRIGDVLGTDRHLGDAVAFSQYTLWLMTRDPVQANGDKVPLVDWNLDADRGYGHHCWDFNRTGSIVEDPDLTDGQAFNAPCTWPSQSPPDEQGHARFDPGAPLKTHWTSVPDPGCDAPGCWSLDVLEVATRRSGDVDEHRWRESPAGFGDHVTTDAGQEWLGRIRLVGHAPRQGLDVQLRSSHPRIAIMPKSVHIPEGRDVVEFVGSSTRFARPDQVAVEITATLNGVTRRAVMMFRAEPIVG